MSHRALTSSIATGLVVAAAAVLVAGPLNPPAGPVASTYKTLSEVEPRIAINATNTPGDADSTFRITAAGSYYLTGNVFGASGKSGIEITTSNVTIDLAGFSVAGAPGSLDGIRNETGDFAINTVVRNGSVQGWGQHGINMTNGGTARESIFERLLISENQGDGLRTSWSSVVRECTANNNSGSGISTLFACTVADCTSYTNANAGIAVQDTSSVVGCLVSNNGGDGIQAASTATITACTSRQNQADGISTADGATITNCTVIGNSLVGIVTGSGSTITACSVRANSDGGIIGLDGCHIADCALLNNFDVGISLRDRCTIRACTSSGSVGFGFQSQDGCSYHDCRADNNFSGGFSVRFGSHIESCAARANTGDGIFASDGSTILNCTAADNNARGIAANNGCQVSGCLTRNNQSDGIAVNFSCSILNNTCNGDGVAAGNQGGIRVLGQANRIEANSVTYADRGLLVGAAGNVIVRNVVKGCTINWDIVANNVCGAILDRTAPATAAISGNSAPSSLGTSDPNANFSY